MAINKFKHLSSTPLDITGRVNSESSSSRPPSPVVFTESIQISLNNTTGGGIIFADDGDIVDLNDFYCSFRFVSGVRIYSAARSGSPVITLGSSGQIQTTGANNTADGGGQIFLNGATGNRIDFNTNGVAPPSFVFATARSSGTKIVLYPQAGASSVDYALGIDGNTLWYSVPTTSQQHRWYAATTQLADLKGTGELVVGTTNLTGTASQRLQVNSGAYVQGNLGIGNTNGEGIKLFVSQGNPAANRSVALITDDGTIPTMTSGATLRISNDGSGPTFALLEAGRLVFTNAGSLGIGTTNPGSTLDVRSTGTQIRAQHSTNNQSILLDSPAGGPRITFGVNADSSFMEFGSYSNFNNLDTKVRDLKIFSTSAPDAFILRQATGNIGIGTTNATNRLTVWGNNNDTTPILALLSGNNSLSFNSGAQIAFGYNGSNTYQHFIHTRHNSGNSDNAIDFYVSDGTQNNTLTSGSVHTMSLVSGSVGINSTSPTSRLDVVGNAKVSGVVTATTFIGQINAGVSTLGITTATTLSVSGVSTFAQISVGGTTGTNQYVLTSTGTGLLWQNVSSLEGITGVNITSDTSTSTSLYVPFVNVSSGTTATQYISTNQFVFKPSTGSLGIGTANPTAKLYVNGDVFVTGITTSTDFDSLSDQNLKTNIETISTPLDKIQRIRGVNFDWKETQRSSMGVIAQEVEKVFPQLVHGDETKTVNYNGLIGLLIECIKEQQKEIDLLKEILKTDK